MVLHEQNFAVVMWLSIDPDLSNIEQLWDISGRRVKVALILLNKESFDYLLFCFFYVKWRCPNSINTINVY